MTQPPVSVKVGLDQPMFKVVYDVDDTLWALNERVFARLEIDFRKDTEYNVMDNPLLTPEEGRALLDGFRQADTFVAMDFYPGADEILAVESLGATVHIHSHCYTPEIADLKRAQLRQLLPDLNPNFINMALISTDPNGKELDEDTFIFVDDNPYNVKDSTAPINIMPKHPWNTTTKAVKVLASNQRTLVQDDWQTVLPSLIAQCQPCVVMARDLKEVNQMVQQAVKIKQETQHGKS